jgi:hypothetical protein
VGLRLALAHGSILTLANYLINYENLKFHYMDESETENYLPGTSEKKMRFLALTVGMAVATVATTAALAPAITPSKHIYTKN